MKTITEQLPKPDPDPPLVRLVLELSLGDLQQLHKDLIHAGTGAGISLRATCNREISKAKWS